MIVAANSGGAKGWGYDSQLIAAANDKWNVAIARNHLDVELLPTVTVSNASPDEIAFQRSLAQAAEDKQAQFEYARVNAERVEMASSRQALPYFIGPPAVALLAAAPEIIPFLTQTGGESTLGALGAGKLISGGVGAVAGYHTDGAWGAVVGAGFGMLASPGLTSLAKTTAIKLGGSSGWLTGIGVLTVGNGIVGSGAAITTNSLAGKLISGMVLAKLSFLTHPPRSFLQKHHHSLRELI
jgi:hypothetical protein